MATERETFRYALDLDPTISVYLWTLRYGQSLVDADGLNVAEGEISTTPQEWSEFHTVIEVSALAGSGMGSIVVFEVADDRSQRHVLQYPLEIVD